SVQGGLWDTPTRSCPPVTRSRVPSGSAGILTLQAVRRSTSATSARVRAHPAGRAGPEAPTRCAAAEAEGRACLSMDQVLQASLWLSRGLLAVLQAPARC